MNYLERAFRMPDIGEGLVSGEIIEWLVKVGDVVHADQPALIVETVKTMVELPLPFGGQVIKIHGGVRDVIPVGEPLMTLLTREDSSGTGDQIKHLVGQRRSPMGSSPIGQAAEVRRLPPKNTMLRVAASPAVRRLARELAIEFDGLVGAGKGGAITAEDVRAAADNVLQERTVQDGV